MEQETTQDIIEEIRKQNFKSLIYQRINAVLLLMFVIIVLMLTPNLIHTLKTADETLNNANEAILHANDAITQMEGTITSIQELTTESGTNMEEAMAKMNSLDVETLNTAIKDLADVVEPMAEFFGRFR